jgi:hypothetical protein
VVVTGTAFSSNFSAGIQGSALSGSNLALEILGATSANTFTSNNGGVLCSNDDNATATCTISNNTFTNQLGNSVFVGDGTSLNNAGVLNARVENNTITQQAGGNNNPIGAFLSGKGTVSKVLINRNSVTSAGEFDGIFVNTPDSGSTPNVNATVTNNTVHITNSTTGAEAIDLAPHQSATACFNVTGNTATTATTGLDGISMTQAGSASVSLEKGVSTSTTASGVLTDNNPNAVAIFTFGTIGIVSNGVCATPP